MTYEMTITINPNTKKAETRTIPVDAPDYSSAWELAFDKMASSFKDGIDFISVENFKRVA
jgi:hypothetical protein